jgi:hypothetical protein
VTKFAIDERCAPKAKVARSNRAGSANKSMGYEAY